MDSVIIKYIMYICYLYTKTDKQQFVNWVTKKSYLIMIKLINLVVTSRLGWYYIAYLDSRVAILK